MMNLNNKHKLKIMYWNCRSYSKPERKQNLILTIQDQLSRKQIQPHIICLSECKLNIDSLSTDELDALLGIPDYQHKYFASREKLNGGLLFYVHNSISYSHYDLLDIPITERTSHSTDIRWLRVNFKSTESSYFLIGSVYLNPSTTEMKYVQPLLHSINRATATGIPFLVGGDFNSKHHSWRSSQRIGASVFEENSNGIKLYDTIIHNNLCVLNTVGGSNGNNIEPTHYANSGHSVIDLALISDLS